MILLILKKQENENNQNNFCRHFKRLRHKFINRYSGKYRAFFNFCVINTLNPLKMRRYFSFIGEVNCRVIKTDSVKEVALVHNVATSNCNVNLYQVKDHPGLVLIIVSSTFCGEYKETHYLALRDSFDCNPAVSVSSFGDNLKRSLSY